MRFAPIVGATVVAIRSRDKVVARTLVRRATISVSGRTDAECRTGSKFAADLFRPYARGLISLVFFSFFTSLLYLVPSVYMMQLSESVMLSRNIMTLMFLTGIAVFLLR